MQKYITFAKKNLRENVNIKIIKNLEIIGTTQKTIEAQHLVFVI